MRHGNAWWRGALLSLGLATVAGCTAQMADEDEGSASLSATHEALLSLRFEEGRLADVELLGIHPRGVLRTLGAPEARGDLHVRVETVLGTPLLDGYLDDPRRQVVEHFDEDGTIHGEEVVVNSTGTLLKVPVPQLPTPALVLRLDGVEQSLRIDLPSIFSDEPEDTEEVSGAALELTGDDADTPPLVHLAGARDPAGKVLFVLLPHGWDSLEDYRAAAETMSQGLLEQSWFRDHPQDVSLWALMDPETNSVPLDSSTRTSRCSSGGAYDIIRTGGPKSTDRYYASTRTSPNHLVVFFEEYCGSVAGGGNVFQGSRSSATFSHELGHALGRVGHEYEASGRSCYPRINVAPPDSIPWECAMYGTPYAADCPDGSPVYAHEGVLDCPDWVRPCHTCKMRSSVVDFCPVCEAAMTAYWRQTVGLSSSERCNGVDDDLDGTVDEGCTCEPSTTPPPSPAPTNLRAVEVSYDIVKLAWNRSYVPSYRVERALDGGAFRVVGTSASSSFSDETVSGNRTYQYRVRAVDGAGRLSPPSASIEVKTPYKPVLCIFLEC